MQRLFCFILILAIWFGGNSLARSQPSVVNRVIAECQLSEYLEFNEIEGQAMSNVGGRYRFTIIDNVKSPQDLKKIPGGNLYYSMSTEKGTLESTKSHSPAGKCAVNAKDREIGISVDTAVIAPSSIVVDAIRRYAVTKIAWKVNLIADKDMDVDLDRLFLNEGLGAISLKAGAASVIAISRTLTMELEKP